jgi:hypothetical protein
MAGSTSVSRSFAEYSKGSKSKRVEKISVSWTADASNGSVPDTSIAMHGYIVKAVTNPGSTAPTSNYDITLGDPDDSALDVLGGALGNRHTSTTEQVYPLIAGAPGTVTAQPVFVSGTHTLAIANNSVNSATGAIHFYLVDEI